MVYLRLLQEFVSARSRKRRPRLPEVFSSAVVNTDLNQKGSVLANGELWSAESVDRHKIPHQSQVTIVGFQDHLLLV